ncbi:MAG: hypothetical protein U0361_05905 [Nitrospiraceae bacterium]
MAGRRTSGLHGRIDFQINCAGFRIELGEIEHVLAQDPCVKQAIVIVAAGCSGDERLVVGVTSGEDEQDLGSSREEFARRCRIYMVPSGDRTAVFASLTLNGAAGIERRLDAGGRVTPSRTILA